MRGLRALNKKTEEKVELTLEVPFFNWSVRSVTILPGDEVVFQAGNQVCIFDRESRKLGVIARGRGPVVVMEE